MNRRGVATLIAIVIIGLLAVVLVAITRSAADVGVRAAIDSGDVQASRLLAAAREIARSQLAGNTADGPVTTPAGTVTLTWNGNGSTRTCAAVVQAGRTRREATFTFDSGRVTKVD